MLDPGQFRTEVVRPVLEKIRMHSPAAENLLVGTALVESGLVYLRQLHGGPALGLYQMEPATHADLYANFLNYRPSMKQRALMWVPGPGRPRHSALVDNLAYATAAVRLQYYRCPDPLPEADDVEGLARTWKRWWNTAAGSGKAAKFVLQYRKHAS